MPADLAALEEAVYNRAMTRRRRDIIKT